jgi:hypothetical protein
MYIQGAAIGEIGPFVGMSIEEVNEVLDKYAYLLGD